MNTEQETNTRVEESELNLGDILQTVLANWYWFVLSVVVCAGAAFLYLKWAPKVYTRTASVLIKDDAKGGAMSESAAFEDLGLFGTKRNVDNEVLVFKSRRLMTEVARNLHLDVSYTVKDGLRTVELYTQSPVQLSFPDAEEAQAFSLKAVPVSGKEVILSGFTLGGQEVADGKPVKVALNDTVTTPVGRVVVVPSLYYGDKYFNTVVQVTKSPLQDVALRFQGGLQATLANKASTIINLTLQDVSIPRAEDVINTLISVYNTDAINDKNQIVMNTSNFINDRLIVIEKELGDVDSDIESYKREHQLTDISSETGMYLQTSSQYRQEGLSLENQLSLAKYIKNYLTDPGKSSDLIPANTGISDVNIESQIGEFNEMLLKRDKLISNSSSKNPVVQDLNNSLIAMKQTIIRDRRAEHQDQEYPGAGGTDEPPYLGRADPAERGPFGGTPPEDQRGTVSLPVEQARGERVDAADDGKQRTYHRPGGGKQCSGGSEVDDDPVGFHRAGMCDTGRCLVAVGGQRHEGALAEGCGGGTLRAVPGRDPDARQEGQERGGGA